MTQYFSDKIKILSLFSILSVIFSHAFNLDDKLNGGQIQFFGGFTWFIEDFISFGITRIAVPFFFLFSGYLFFLNSPRGQYLFSVKIKKRFKTLLIPFLFWSIFGILFYLILQTIPFTAIFFTKKHIADFSLKELLATIFVSPIPYQLWFIRDLILVVLLTPLLSFLLNHFWKWTLMVLFLIWFLFENNFDNSFEALFFFTSGGFISMYTPDKIEIKLGKISWLFAAIWISFALLKAIILSSGQDLLLVRIVYKTSVIAGIFAVWGLYDFFSQTNKIKDKLIHLSVYTFFVYASHEPTLTITKKVLFVLLGDSEINFLEVYFIAPLVSIALCFLMASVVKRYFNFMYGVITGGR